MVIKRNLPSEGLFFQPVIIAVHVVLIGKQWHLAIAIAKSHYPLNYENKLEKLDH